jgi:hypothetical protein
MGVETKSRGSVGTGGTRVWLGASIMCAAAAWMGWSLWSQLPPNFDRLQQLSGAVEQVVRSGDARPMVEVTVDGGSGSVSLWLDTFDRLPTRDYPVTSLQRGDKIVAWTSAHESGSSRREIWQLYLGRRPVVSYADRAALAAVQLRREFAYLAIAAVLGSVLVGAGMSARRQGKRSGGEHDGLRIPN